MYYIQSINNYIKSYLIILNQRVTLIFIQKKLPQLNTIKYLEGSIIMII